MITANQLVAHLVGDYLLQSDWMAQNKSKSWVAAIAHAVLYTVPFLLLTRSPVALLVICGTHVVIDHWRLARYVVWAKNWLAPPSGRPSSWEACSGTGYEPDTPPWLSTWLLILADNTMHVVINGLAISYL